MRGRIIIELATEKTPDSGSGLPDLGHDAYWLKKEIPKLEFKDANGKVGPISDKYEVVRLTTSVEPT